MQAADTQGAVGKQIGAPGHCCLLCHYGGASAAAARRMAAVLPASGAALADVRPGPLQQQAVAEGVVCCFLPPSPGWQVGSAFPAVSWDDTRCRTGLCVISGELLMSHGSCGVNNLSASVNHLGSLMDPSQWYQSILRAVTPQERLWAAGNVEASQALCRRHAAPRPLPPAVLTLFLSPRSHTLSLPVPSFLPPAVSLSCPKGLVLSLACWKCCQ